MRRGSSLLAAAVALASVGMVASVPPANTGSPTDEARPARGTVKTKRLAQQQRDARLRDTMAEAIFGRGGWRTPRYPRPGWSVRQGQRMALKRRNQKRHRAACRR